MIGNCPRTFALLYSSLKLTSRQQLHVDDNQKLAGFLNLQTEEVRNYDVFVFELCQGNISKESQNGLAGSLLELNESISVCDQLLERLIQLEKANVCHNDLKPDNILFKHDHTGNLEIKIGDFGQAGRTGGTPGWTWPKFLSERRPGKSDTYSMGLLLLYVMSANREVFYRIRNNYVEDRGQQWLADFREDPFIKLIIDMIHVKQVYLLRSFIAHKNKSL